MDKQCRPRLAECITDNSKILLVVTCVCAFVHMWRVYSRGFIEDPDISTFILMAQSFWSGDIFYKDFFDPKLPHVLPVYSLSLISGSILGHLVVTYLCICATGLLIVGLGRNIWGGILYIALAYISPGGLTGHLSIFANLLVAGSIYSYVRFCSLLPFSRDKFTTYVLLIFSALLAGWAVGLRPNYGFVLIPVLVWILTRRELPKQTTAIWICCFGISFLAPIFIVLHQAELSFTQLLDVFRSWNGYFYASNSVSDFWDRLLLMYSHPVGPTGLYFLITVPTAIALWSLSKRFSILSIIFVFAIASLWLSYYVTHLYNHYILMDVLLACLLVSSVRIESATLILLALMATLWAILLLTPNSPHSAADASIIKTQNSILSWLKDTESEQVVSPQWLTPHWISRSRIPTQGIHPEWSIGLLDRYDFKKLESVKKLDLDATWTSQCNNWGANASFIIATPQLFERCEFHSFQLVPRFSDSPIRVWVRK